MPDTEFTQEYLSTVDDANKKMKILLILVFLMNLVLAGSLKYMIMVIRFL
jgi:hypothetical protein